MQKWKKLFINLFWLFEILFFIGELIKEGKGVLETLLPAFSAGADSFYFASIGTGAIALCYINYDMWSGWRHRVKENKPENRFRKMYYDLKKESTLSLDDVEYPLSGRSQTEQFQAREALRHALSKLGIPAPVATMKMSKVCWSQFIGIMAVYAKDGRLEEARRLHDELDGLGRFYD